MFFAFAFFFAIFGFRISFASKAHLNVLEGQVSEDDDFRHGEGAENDDFRHGWGLEDDEDTDYDENIADRVMSRRRSTLREERVSDLPTPAEAIAKDNLEDTNIEKKTLYDTT